MIEVAEHVVARPQPNVVGPTPAVLFHMIDHDTPTLFIDEIDKLDQSSALQAILNAGYRIGGTVPRMVTIDKQRQVKHYNVFCPKMFAGIGDRKLPLSCTVASRSIEVRLLRRLPQEHIEPFTHADAERHAAPLRAALEGFAAANIEQLRGMVPEMPEQLGGRAADCWMPLVAIADLVGDDWPERARAAAVALSGAHEDEPDENVQLLRDLERVWRQHERDKMHTDDMLAAIDTLDDRQFSGSLNESELSQRLRRFGINPEPNAFRLEGRRARGYRRSSFTDLFERYVGDR